MADLVVGQVAPSFTLQCETGETISLSQYQGKVVVLYFYPKDNTETCAREACAFRDRLDVITQNGAVVLGVSRDSVSSHRKFADKYELNFPILADVTGDVCVAYGVLKEKTMFGRTGIGIERTTFVIDPKGKIAKIFPKVKVNQHVDQVLDAILSL